MAKFLIGLCMSVLTCSLIAAPRVAVADTENLLRDPGFEQRLQPNDGGWILFEGSKLSSETARTGQRSVHNSGFSQKVEFPPFLIGGAAGSYQEFPATAGSQWRLTGYGLTPTALKGTPAFGVLQLSFFDSYGNDLGTVETARNKTTRAKISDEISAKTDLNEWIFLDTGIATAPLGTATVQAFTLFVDYSGARLAQGVYFDDLTLCAIDDDDNSSCGDAEN